jgi:fructan beta-fructosidase
MDDDETYRPRFHFTPRAGWMNDPNGLVFYEGEYHLFFQHLWPRHWGHAVSRDLAHWEELPIALEPDALGAIWSGSAVVDRHDTSGFFGGGAGLVAVFTYSDASGGQSQGIAYSADRGRTWTKYAGNPVLTGDVRDFRDPKVFWHGPTGRWVMALATGYTVSLYTSPDLKDWAFASTFDIGQREYVWECPDLFPLPLDGDPERTRWVLTVSWLGASIFSTPDRRGESGTRYFVGAFDGTTFTAEEGAVTPLPLGHGPDDYAAVSWSDAPDGRRLVIGWMNHWSYASKTPTAPFQGALTLPRELFLRSTPDGGMRLFQRPAPELRALRGEATAKAQAVTVPAGGAVPLPGGDGYEILIEWEPSDGASEFGLRVLAGGDGEETWVGYDRAAGAVFVDRTRSGRTDFSPHFAARRHGVPLAPVRAGRVRLHVFVDRSSVEVFANDSAAYLSALIFPHDGGRRDTALYARGGDAHVRSLNVYPLH